MTPVIITVEIKTPNALNRREHHMARHRRIRSHRTQAFLAVRASLAAARVQPPCTVTMTRIAPSEGLDAHDGLPASLKGLVDGVADALGLDDGDERLTWRYDQRRGPWAVEIKLEARP